jgi:hypothetical protein
MHIGIGINIGNAYWNWYWYWQCNSIGIVMVWYGVVLLLVWYCIGMHIISNAYHFHALVCNGIGIGIGIGMV